MTTLIDFILELFRSPAAAASYVANPEGALRDAGLPNVSAAQLASVAASAAPAGIALGNGDPVYGLQRAVADYHSIASPFSPQTAFTSQPTFAPETNTDFMSGNSTDLASHNNVPVMSPNQDAGANAQQGAFNLGFGDITLGDKTSNTATNGAVVNTGHADGPIVTGDGAVLGHGNTVNNGDVWAGSGSHVNVGEGNAIEDSSQHAGGNVISGNDGPVISDVDMSGGHGGGASASGGGGLLGIGGGHASGGDGGNAGSIVISDSSNHAVGGNQTTAGHDVGSGNSSVIDSSVHSSTSTSTTHSVEDNSSSYSSNIASGNESHTALGSGNETHTAFGSGNESHTALGSGNSYDSHSQSHTDVASHNPIETGFDAF
ncbi:IniB N-terminal domain-containing protein [Mycobacterium sp. NPDC051198]|uniref:IniB N-terminal domain-containing protein n=1 Tax=Mycolicibacterium peregrinum TaxID=43304 RepID=UPI0006D7A626|nr:IniB N-terminal domain-containing protein [Mycolicibacterium peregrinum]MCV7201094.1 hypothetical protein [Mycolicibacterium peregrinum]ORW57850.1 hypothetical protein AWC21_16495 [Mycolicibacterium peregrinum]